MPTTRSNRTEPNAQSLGPMMQHQTEVNVERDDPDIPSNNLPNPDDPEQQQPRTRGRPRARRVNATALAQGAPNLANGNDTSSPTKARKRGQELEENNNPAAKKVKAKANTSQPSKKAKDVKRTAVVNRRDPLPDRPGRNVHPAKVTKPTTTRRTSQEVAAEHEAKKRAMEEKIREGEKAKEFLALMNINEDIDDDELLTENPQRLSAAIRKHGRDTDDEGEVFDFDAVENAVYSDESASVEPAKVKPKVSQYVHASVAIVDSWTD